jgi:hypothetical protein
MDFSTKLAQTRAYTTTNQNGVDSQEVYNEAILQAVELTNPTNNPQVFESFYINGASIIQAGIYSSLSFFFSSDYIGTFQGNGFIEGNTIINLSAKTSLDTINIEVISGKILVNGILNSL